MSNKIEKIKLSLKKIKLEHLIIVCAVIAVIGIFSSTFSSKKDLTEKTIEQYVQSLEDKLSTQLSKIDGAGKVSVLISVKHGLTTEIATEKTTTNGSSGIVVEEVPILVSGKPIVLTEVYPEISGVIIVAKGASDLKVRTALLCATQTFLNVTSDKIEILTMR